MSKATENALSTLHGELATVITSQLKESVLEVDEETGATSIVHTATPALLTVAARFLKDNEITCEAGESTGLSELKQELANRRRGRGKLALIRSIDEELESHG